MKTISICEEYEGYFDNCYVFGKGEVYTQISCLKELNNNVNSPQPVILTTSNASLGHDFTPIAYVIQTFIPDSWATFMQNAGRSNRIEPNAALIGAILTCETVASIDALK